MGLRETAPTYRSLFLRYEPLELSRAALIASPRSADGELADRAQEGGARRAGRFPAVTIQRSQKILTRPPQLLGLSAQVLAATPRRRRLSRLYVWLRARLVLSRRFAEALAIAAARRVRADRRRKAPCSSAAGFRLSATNPMPTGWYVVGRTPERLFSPQREPPFLIEPGDVIRFEPIDAATFKALDVARRQGRNRRGARDERAAY